MVVQGVAVAAIATLCVGWPASQAHAASTVISNGPISLGIMDTGNLGSGVNNSIPGSGTGLVLAGVGDAISPGCFCEGWGASGNGISGYADISVDGVNNLTVDSFTSTPSTAISATHLTSLPDLTVTQSYAPSAGAPNALFEDQVTITNNGSNTINDVRYRRVMDWDIPPTQFNEYVTIGGLPAADLLFSSNNGFATANPLGGPSALDGATVNTNFVDFGPKDQGSLFDFGFGSLGAGESKMFSIFYGATYNEPDAYTALANVGAEVYALGESSGRTVDGPNWITGEPGTYIFGFKGVGGTPVSPSDAPEPCSLALLGLGAMGLAAKRRNGRRSAI
jgi:type IV pilus assembly protein PilY1